MPVVEREGALCGMQRGREPAGWSARASRSPPRSAPRARPARRARPTGHRIPWRATPRRRGRARRRAASAPSRRRRGHTAPSVQARPRGPRAPACRRAPPSRRPPAIAAYSPIGAPCRSLGRSRPSRPPVAGRAPGAAPVRRRRGAGTCAPACRDTPPAPRPIARSDRARRRDGSPRGRRRACRTDPRTRAGSTARWSLPRSPAARERAGDATGRGRLREAAGARWSGVPGSQRHARVAQAEIQRGGEVEHASVLIGSATRCPRCGSAGWRFAPFDARRCSTRRRCRCSAGGSARARACSAWRTSAMSAERSTPGHRPVGVDVALDLRRASSAPSWPACSDR